MNVNAICVGCDRSSLGFYTKDDPVETDGTYADGKFVCTACYVFLVDIGRDVGTPQEVQSAAIEFVRPLNV